MYGYLAQSESAIYTGYALFNDINDEKEFLNGIYQAPDTCYSMQTEGQVGFYHRSMFNNGANLYDLNAGQVLTMSNELGSLGAALLDVTLGNHEQYTYEFPPIQHNGLDEVTIDIPGMEFPAFTGVTIPALEYSTPLWHEFNSDGAIDFFEPLTWIRATRPGSVYKFGVQVEFEDGSEIYFRCVAEDDGEFTFPIEVQFELSRPDVDWFDIYYGREASYILETDNAMLVRLPPQFCLQKA